MQPHLSGETPDRPKNRQPPPSREGVLPADVQLARWLERVLPAGGPPQKMLVANKAETKQAQQGAVSGHVRAPGRSRLGGQGAPRKPSAAPPQPRGRALRAGARASCFAEARFGLLHHKT
jgi:hypothetical protein